MEHTVTTKKWYVVTGTAGATVTSPDGSKTFCTIPDGGQGTFYATTPKVVTSDDSVEVIEATFNSAPVKMRLLGLLGGGASNGLPSGYLAAEFLESTGEQYVLTEIHPERLNAKVKWESRNNTGRMLCFDYSSQYYRAFQYLDTAKKTISINVDASIADARFPNDVANNPLGCVANVEINSDKNYISVNGKVLHPTSGVIATGYKDKSGVITLFSATNKYNKIKARLYAMKFWRADGAVAEFAFAVDQNGVPCMFDKVTRKPFYNSGTGQFIVGMTMKQARKLSKLPAGGGTLKVSLPSNYLEDEGVTNAIAAANAKGWNIEVASTFEADGASATFALRRIWVRKTQDEQGNYIDADGVRWQVESCVAMYNADGSEPDAHGYEPFRSVEAATEYWDLTAWVDPEQEELLTNTDEQ